ncbi:MAG: hypothetical protein WBO08_00165 [Mycobacterium sp.]
MDPVLPACAQALAAGTINTGHITITGTAVKKASATRQAARAPHDRRPVNRSPRPPS